MGLSFDDETSLKEAADSMRFAPDALHSVPELRSTEKENDGSCENGDIQMSERRSASETMDKFIELEDSCMHKEGDSVESV
jgi:hypothetical protein